MARPIASAMRTATHARELTRGWRNRIGHYIMSNHRHDKATAPDMAVRQEALAIRRSFILEAPAGSGKTALLTARFLSLLADVKHPRQVLAVTFTRKAAAEMSARITTTLQQARSGNHAASNPWEALLMDLARRVLNAHPEWDILLRNPESLMVDTFHGFCALIARNWPLEARVAPGLPLLDDMGQEALLAAAVTRYLHTFATNDPRLNTGEMAAFQRRLVAANNSIRTITGQISDLLARRDRLMEFVDLFRRPTARDDLEARVERLVSVYLGRIHDYFITRQTDWNSLKETLENTNAGMAELLTTAVPGTTLKDLPVWQNAAQVFLKKSGTPWKQFQKAAFGAGFSKNPLADFISDLPYAIASDLSFIKELPGAQHDNVGYEALQDMIVLAGGALRQFRALLNTRGLDFMELELAAIRALEQCDRPSESLIFFHERLRHILVDEAQDMNDTQVRILGTLTEGWEANDGRTVFLVGDPKQSIFRFRRAEVSLFDALKAHGLPRRSESFLPLQPLTLTANFRSRPGLVEFTNRVFSHVMDTPDQAFDEVKFEGSQTTRDAPRPGSTPVTLGLFYCRQANNRQLPFPLKQKAREQEARYVATSVAQCHWNNPHATIAVLIPARTHLANYVMAMEKLDIPVRLMEGIPMLERFEVRHMLNLFKVLLRPYDDTAWAGALRAPWCRVPLTVMEQLAAITEPAPWSGKILTVGRATHPAITRFVNAYEIIRPDFGREPYAVSLQRFWEELEGPAAVTRLTGASGVSNIMRLLELLGVCGAAEGSQAPAGCGEESLDFLERLLQQAYTPPDPRAVFSPVTMLTIHKAKGLEFDHVFAVGLDHSVAVRRSGDDMSGAFLLDRLQGNDRVYLAASVVNRHTDSSGLACRLLADMNQRRNMAESKRLFYVAATRARETLTLTGLLQQTNHPQPETRLVSAIDWLKHVTGNGQMDSSLVTVRKNPVPTQVRPPRDKTTGQLPAPAPFEPQPLPYFIQSPSKIEDETATAARPGTDEPDGESRARGVVMHRIFETLARHQAPPKELAVVMALAEENIGPKRRKVLAREILDECQQAWAFEPFVKARDNATEVMPEWSIEDASRGKVIRVGRVDLVLKTATGIFLVDFKTGKPAGNEDVWLKTEVDRYRPQLAAYAEMAAKVLAPSKLPVHPVLFFTALPRWVEIR